MKILALDIETSPNVVYTWGLFKQNVGLNQIVQPGEVICFSAKWVGEDKGSVPYGQRVKRDGTVFYGGLKHDHEDMLYAAHRLLDEADVVLHYNGKRFDMPHLNREFLEAGMPPPSPYAQIDLLAVVRSQFRFLSNRLQYVTTALGLEGKVEHGGFDLWVRCLAGEPLAWRRMEKYNRQDVVLLEELYDLVLPWIPNHPTRTLRDGHGVCPRCGSEHVQRRGLAYTKVSAFQQYQCQVCHGWFRGTKRLASTEGTEVAA